MAANTMNHVTWPTAAVGAEAHLSYTQPASYYTSPEVFAQERERIFARSWQLACHVSQVAEPGDYCTLELLDEHLIVIRSDDGVVRAFFNVCAHRGHQLLQGAGRISKRIVCPYHAWSYDNSGALRHAKNCRNVPGFDVGSVRLSEVRVEEFASFVFVNLDPKAQPLRELMGELEDDMLRSAPRLVDLKLRHTMTQVLKANWKVAVENYCECYHCTTAHPTAMKAWYGVENYRVDVRGRYQIHSTTTRGEMASEVPAPLRVTKQYRAWIFFPYTALQVYPAHLNVMRWVPIDVGTTRYIEDWYVLGDELSDANRAAIEFRANFVQVEDTAICESVQVGLRSRGYRPGRLMIDGSGNGTSEHGVQHHQRMVLEAMSRPA